MRASLFWLGLGGITIAVLPWYALEGDGLLSADWLRAYPAGGAGPALYHIVWGGRPWLLLPVLPWLGLVGLAVARGERSLVLWSGIGLALLLFQGFAIIHTGPVSPWLAALLPAGAH